MLFDTNQRARKLGKTFRLQLHTATIVRRAFEISGVLNAIEHTKSREEALAPAGRKT